MSNEIIHKSVLADEVLELLRPEAGGVFVDGTIGSGGHAELILECIGSTGVLLGIDRDKEAIERARRRLKKFGKQCEFETEDFSEIAEIAERHSVTEVDGVLLDLGVSSEQLTDAHRGFSFSREGPLDMRMNVDGDLTASDLVNGLDVDELRRVIREFGEERASGRIARAIVRARSDGTIKSTVQLAEIIAKAKGGRRGKIHPATKTFQALRIAVNRELDSLRRGLEGALRILKQGGRLGVISFHSLEDRIVKQLFREHAGVEESLQEGGSVLRRKEPGVRLLNRKPIVADELGIRENPRARSAKLRAVARI